MCNATLIISYPHNNHSWGLSAVFNHKLKLPPPNVKQSTRRTNSRRRVFCLFWSLSRSNGLVKRVFCGLARGTVIATLSGRRRRRRCGTTRMTLVISEPLQKKLSGLPTFACNTSSGLHKGPVLYWLLIFYTDLNLSSGKVQNKGGRKCKQRKSYIG